MCARKAPLEEGTRILTVDSFYKTVLRVSERMLGFTAVLIGLRSTLRLTTPLNPTGHE